MEICQRCGESGEDRRTLWMACFYAMNELGLPFEEKVLFHAKPEELTKAKDPVVFDGKITLAPGSVKCSGELTPHGLFTLRVCKDCRADWMGSIKSWFESRPHREDEPETGIFVRDMGRNRQVTPEEFEAMRKNRE